MKSCKPSCESENQRADQNSLAQLFGFAAHFRKNLLFWFLILSMMIDSF